MKQFVLAFAAVCGGSVVMTAFAQSPADWPRRPVRLVVPFAAGGGNDITARIIAPALTERLGQQFVVDNRPGAAGNIGVELVAKAPPDGYTILVGNVSTNAINPTGFASVLKFDITKETTGVTMLSRIPNVMVSGMAFPPNSLKEFVAYAKARPGALNFSNPIGAYSHLDMLDFMSKAGIKLVNIPSKGAGSSFAPIIAGEIHTSMINAATATPQIKGGRLKAFVTTAKQRLPDLPDVPTMAEAGFPNTGSELWIGFFVPSKTPRDIVAKLYQATAQVTQQPAVKEAFEKAKVPLSVSASPAEFQKYVAEEVQRWNRIIKENNVTFQ